MSLSDLASIGSFVSALAVLVSLVYLSLQVRQAEKNQQAAIRTARASRIVDLFMGCTDPAVAQAVRKGMRGADDISDSEVFQFMNFALARFFNAEDAFYQRREGLLNEFYFEGVTNGLKFSLSSPGMRALYRRQRSIFGHEFAQFADALLASTPVEPDVDSSASFKRDVAAELSGKI